MQTQTTTALAARLSFAAVRAQLKAAGLTIRKTGEGEEVRVAFPRNESAAYYTDDLADALASGLRMAQEAFPAADAEGVAVELGAHEPGAPFDLAELAEEEVAEIAEELGQAEPAVDFTAHAHPVQAVACPDCGRRVGTWCVRPSGHKAASFHASRKAEADRVFIAQHGEAASIERTAEGGWRIDPTGRADREAAELDQVEEAEAEAETKGAPYTAFARSANLATEARRAKDREAEIERTRRCVDLLAGGLHDTLNDRPHPSRPETVAHWNRRLAELEPAAEAEAPEAEIEIDQAEAPEAVLADPAPELDRRVLSIAPATVAPSPAWSYGRHPTTRRARQARADGWTVERKSGAHAVRKPTGELVTVAEQRPEEAGEEGAERPALWLYASAAKAWVDQAAPLAPAEPTPAPRRGLRAAVRAIGATIAAAIPSASSALTDRELAIEQQVAETMHHAVAAGVEWLAIFALLVGGLAWICRRI